MIVKIDEEYMKLLNEGVARELQVSVQYMIQHTKIDKIRRYLIKEDILLDKTHFDAIGEFLKKFAIEEMKHAGKIIERIYILGGSDAVTKPSTITIGGSLKDFAIAGVKAEEEALELYRKVITKAMALGDWETEQMFKGIYSQEEGHLIKFQDYIEMLPEPSFPDTPESEWQSIFTPEYITLLNKALAAETSAIIQYTNQHEKVNAEKMRRKNEPIEVIRENNKNSVIGDMLKPIFMQEMNHFEKIAERIHEIQRDAKANVDPKPKIGTDVETFIKDDREAENYAIVLYRQIINEATKLGDIKTRRLVEDIIQEEEAHYWKFDDYLP
jgi:bacterioferritin